MKVTSSDLVLFISDYKRGVVTVDAPDDSIEYIKPIMTEIEFQKPITSDYGASAHG